MFLRLLEAAGLRDESVVTGGWESRGYKQFRGFAPELVRGDESEGYALLLQLIFDDLATELPGLFGDVRLTPSFQSRPPRCVWRWKRSTRPSLKAVGPTT